MGVGNFVFIGDVVDFENGLLDDSSALVVGTDGIHVGELKNGEAPGRSSGEDDEDKNEFFDTGELHVLSIIACEGWRIDIIGKNNPLKQL